MHASISYPFSARWNDGRSEPSSRMPELRLRNGRRQMKSEQLRFWEKVRIGWPNDCWLWQASTNEYGYGRFRVGARLVKAHRYALLAAHGRLDDERHVLHSCDNPPCCNPRHLRLGTQAENVADMHARGRNGQPKGETHCHAKLTDDAVREIRRLLAGGVRQREIAAAYGVAAQQISEIKLDKAWRHVK